MDKNKPTEEEKPGRTRLENAYILSMGFLIYLSIIVLCAFYTGWITTITDDEVFDHIGQKAGLNSTMMAYGGSQIKVWDGVMYMTEDDNKYTVFTITDTTHRTFTVLKYKILNNILAWEHGSQETSQPEHNIPEIELGGVAA